MSKIRSNRAASMHSRASMTYVDACKYFWQREGDLCAVRTFDLLRYMKLVYLAHAFHLLLGEKGFVGRDWFEAWEQGPVLPDLYYASRGEDSVRFVEQLDAGEPRLIGESEMILDFAWERYGGLGSWELIDLTQTEGGPWDSNYRGRRTRNVIPDSDIKEHYEYILARLAQKP